jgi:lantibiotic modifying enzyme
VHAKEALLDAWPKAASFQNVVQSAAATGVFPFNKELILIHRFVHELSDEERERTLQRIERRKNRLDINNMVLTNKDNIEKIVQNLILNRVPAHIMGLPPGVSYSAFVKGIVTRDFPNVKLLSRIPPYFKITNQVIYVE